MVRVRIPPSPTGESLHVGNLYTALINWVFAKKHKGKFIIRIEDTDRERFFPGSEEKILATLKAYGLFYDEGPDIGGPYGPYRQSERLPIYQKYAKELVEKDYAYYCFCTKERLDTLRKEQNAKGKISRYDKYCLNNVKNPQDRIVKGEKYVIRLKIIDNKTVWFKDLIHGEIKFDSNQLDDQILIKSDGYPTYHLGVVVDDHLMKITHIIRAEEWISSTPKHIILYEAFKWDVPIFAHVPILRNPDRSKLSKRKNSVWASWYLEQGYLPKAMLNYLALMGWSHPEDKDIFSIDELIRYFDLKDINSAGPIFDLQKLTWMNGEYIRMTDNKSLKSLIADFYKDDQDVISFMKGDSKAVDLILILAKTRMKTLKDLRNLIIPAKPELSALEKNIAKTLSKKFSAVSKWGKETILIAMKETLNTHKAKGSILYRIMTGFESGLPLPETLEILGKEKTLERIKRAFD